MGILDSGSAPPTYVEPGEDRRKQAMLGLEMAKPFNEAFQSGLNRGEQRRQFDLSQKERAREFDLEQPLRQAQAASAQAQLQGIKAKSFLESLNAAKAADWEQGKVDALAFEGTLGGDYSRTNRVKFLDFVQKVNPALADTPWFNDMEKKFATSDMLERKKTEEMDKLKYEYSEKEKIAKIQNDARAIRSDASQAQKLGVQLYDETGNEIPGARQQMLDAAKEKNTPYAIRKADAFVEELSKSRPELSQDQLSDAKTRFLANPASMNPDAVSKRQIEAMDESSRGLDQAVANIEKFNAKFGPNAFDKFTGPIEARIQKFRSQYAGFSEDDARLARQIESQVEQQVQIYRKENFGSALTESELNRFKRIVDDPNSAAYLDTVKSFKETLKDSVARRLENYPYSTSLSKPLVDRYKGRKPGEWFMPQENNGGAKLPPGWKMK
jgi:hypothetical protein